MMPKPILWVIYFVVLGMLVGGCATFARTNVVEVPVPVPCRVPDIPRPSFAIDTVKTDADVFVVTRALWATVEQWEGYEVELQAAIAACK